MGSWHTTLNNHASTRPKEYGGALVQSVQKCKTFTPAAPGSASAPWRCSLDLPNSFSPGDGRRVQVEAEGNTKEEASEKACRLAMARLLVADSSQVILRPKHWNVSPDALLAQMPGNGEARQALPAATRKRSQASGSEGATLGPAERDARVADVVRDCLRLYGV